MLLSRTPWMKRILHCTLNQADIIICDADHIAQALSKFTLHPERIHLINFGTDIDLFKPKKAEPKLQEALNLGDAPVVISLRNLSPVYDVGSLIAAVPFVLCEYPDTRFLVAGDGKQRNHLGAMAKMLGVSHSVTFIGSIANDELPNYINLADIYVSTSLSDAGLAASTAEAMSCGLPVVVTDFGDNRKWVEDGVNGFVAL